VPFDKVAVAVSCDCPTAVKLDVPETDTLDTVGAAGGAGGAGAAGGVGAVGVSFLLEQLTLAAARNAAIHSVVLVTSLAECKRRSAMKTPYGRSIFSRSPARATPISRNS
jgi:hypothetical protein